MVRRDRLVSGIYGIGLIIRFLVFCRVLYFFLYLSLRYVFVFFKVGLYVYIRFFFFSFWMILSFGCWGGYIRLTMFCGRWRRFGIFFSGVCLWIWCWGCRRSRWGRGLGSCGNCFVIVTIIFFFISCFWSGVSYFLFRCSRVFFLFLISS